MWKYLNKCYPKVENDPYYLYAEGDIPIALVAHLDTIVSMPPTEIYHDIKNKVMWSPQLLGADDRAGIYAIIQIIDRGFRPTIILTTDEEQGGLGAQALALAKPKCPLENLKAIIELDRRGKNDCVFYDCDNREFVKYIESFGFEENFGSFTDISFIAPQWGIAAVNLSIGYENEHQLIELLHTDWVDNTIDKVEAILCAAKGMPQFKYIQKKRATLMVLDNDHCTICNSQFNNDKHLVKDMYGEYYICSDCLRSYF